jgi:23S rRNA (adenine2030-N6)-methyltransferase
VKDARTFVGFANQIAHSGVRRVLRLELAVDEAMPGGKLARTGLILINPPYMLDEEAAILLPVLARKLARTSRAQVIREWLAGE